MTGLESVTFSLTLVSVYVTQQNLGNYALDLAKSVT
jgi:hypothetical protein